MGGGHSAARFSPKRGYVYYPYVQSDRSIDTWTRGELVRKSAWAYDEIGWVGGLIDKSAKMCAKITQKAKTTDEAWNMLADAAFERATGSAEYFDLSGKFNWKGLVKACFSGNFRLGDSGIILATAEDGSPRIKFVESYAIGDDREAQDDDRWTDGLLLDKHGKAQAYRVLDAEGGHKDYHRADFIFDCSYLKPGQNRGYPKTYRMLNKIQDAEEIESFWSGGIKASSQIGFQIVNSKTDGGAAQGMGSAVASAGKSFEGRTAEVVYTEDLNGSSKILEMNDERIELLHDKRPAPDQVAHLDYQKRDCAAGFGLPIEACWNWGRAGSAIARTLLAEVQDFIDDEQLRFIDHCGVRLRNWVIALEMEAGRLRPCKDPDWSKHSWMYGARKTADFAKDGRIYLEALNRGELSPDRYHAMQNQDVDVEDDITIKRWAKRKKMCDDLKLNVNYVFPPAPGTPVSPDVAEGVDNLKENNDEE